MLRRHSSLLLCVPISTHVVSSGGTSSMMTPGMVDVSPKSKTHREATAIGHIWFPPKVAKQMLSAGNDEHGSTSTKNKNNNNNSSGILEFCTKKGPIFTTAVIAATQAAKQTSNLIPFCHPIPITKCKVEWDTLSMVTMKNLSRSYNVRDAKFHVPFHLIEPTSGLMDLLEVNPKFHAKVCHDFVTSENNTCPRGSSCPFVHPDLSSGASDQEKRDHYQQEWFPESGREVLDKINDIYFRTLNQHPTHQHQPQQRGNKRHPYHHQHQQHQNHIILDKDNKLPELINVQGCLVPTEELELNRCINRVLEDPTAATKWCKDGEKCRNIDSCGFAHRRTTKRNKRLDRSAFWPSPSFLQDCKIQTAEKYGLRVYAKVTVGCGEWHTGVEMEALTATSTALLTLYDMCKGIDGAVDGGMRLGRVQLVEKIGGKSGHWQAAGTTSTTGSTSSGNSKNNQSTTKNDSSNQGEHFESADSDGF